MLKLNKITKDAIGINKSDMLAHLKCIVCDSDHLATYSNLTEEEVTERLEYISKIIGLPISSSVTHLINLVFEDLENATIYVGNFGLPSIRYNFSRHENIVGKMDKLLGTDSCLVISLDKEKGTSSFVIKNENDLDKDDIEVVSSLVFKKTQSLSVLLDIAYTNFYNLIVSYYKKCLMLKK